MAFIIPTPTPPLTSSFLPSRPPLCRISNRVPLTSRRLTPNMTFSSIDAPETATKCPDSALSTKLLTLHAAYKQIFGNVYLMDSERASLATIESDFLDDKIDVRELVRAMGKSPLYRSRFFERSGPYRFVELNCKHFLGRAPLGQQEISIHVQTIVNQGYDAEIDSYIDSEEYENLFGAYSVPRFVFKGKYPRNDDFNRMTIMRKYWDGCSTSTVNGSTQPAMRIPAQLIMSPGGYVNGFVGIQKGLPAGFRPQPTPERALPPIPLNAQAGLKVRMKVADNLYQVYEVPGQVQTEEPQWKKERQGVKRWNGVWF